MVRANLKNIKNSKLVGVNLNSEYLSKNKNISEYSNFGDDFYEGYDFDDLNFFDSDGISDNFDTGSLVDTENDFDFTKVDDLGLDNLGVSTTLIIMIILIITF
jgi:hypothetical protein